MYLRVEGAAVHWCVDLLSWKICRRMHQDIPGGELLLPPATTKTVRWFKQDSNLETSCKYILLYWRKTQNILKMEV